MAGGDLILAGVRVIFGVPSYDEVNKGLEAQRQQSVQFAEEMQKSHRAIAIALLHSVQMIPPAAVGDDVRDDVIASVMRLKELAK